MNQARLAWKWEWKMGNGKCRSKRRLAGQKTPLIMWNFINLLYAAAAGRKKRLRSWIYSLLIWLIWFSSNFPPLERRLCNFHFPFFFPRLRPQFCGYLHSVSFSSFLHSPICPAYFRSLRCISLIKLQFLAAFFSNSPRPSERFSHVNFVLSLAVFFTAGIFRFFPTSFFQHTTLFICIIFFVNFCWLISFLVTHASVFFREYYF